MDRVNTRRVIVGAMAFALLTAASFVWSNRADAGGSGAARAVLQDQAGSQIGVVQFIQQGEKVLVKADVTAAIGTFPAGVAAGFKGFHIHAGGGCTGNFVSSAASHFGHDGATPTATPHGTHEGDMPVLLVNEDGSASLRFVTDRISVEEILGRTVILHAAPDNYANVTAYGTPTAATLATGDAGGRYGCGVIG